ncbi:glycoside hydrolase [Ectothiorhodospiraceae bacterium 2226]|nr:glycoside hydrolase [Ectothiorhodospiraceae bacterium 2226]
MPAKRLPVVLCWHMHQPQYKDLVSGEYLQPWTYLHAIKDYVDMAALLEQQPEARAVVNFAPILIEQIEDYAAQVRAHLAGEGAVRDPLLAALDAAALPTGREARLGLIRTCLRANEARMIQPFTPLAELAELGRFALDHPHSVDYLADEYFADLVVWYHLVWLGETVRMAEPRAQQLIKKARAYTLHDRRLLMGLIKDLLEDLLPRYRRLAERGQVELATSPYAHPIVPLLLDLGSAEDAMPGFARPLLPQYPGGEARTRWHIERGLQVFERAFGHRPAGCWPSEGAVSVATLKLLAEYGFRWAASGGTVLGNSQAAAERGAGECPHRAYRVQDVEGLHCFFRDDGLSDLIGFTYSDWHGDDAVNNLVHHLEEVANACSAEAAPVVSIIMDGENAWEHYPQNGYHFLRGLYRRLAEHPQLELTTYAELLARAPEAATLPRLVSGSWVYGTFSTWIGESDKNRGWDLLGAAKQAFDQAVAQGRLSGERLAAAERQLAVCEGSDWFWWFGDYNAAESVSDFERLFRLHLANLYQLIGDEPPEDLTHVLSHGGGAPEHGGAMRRSH